MTEKKSKYADKNDNEITSIRCSFALKKFLEKYGFKGETDEHVIWRLFSQITPDKDMLKEIKKMEAAYEDKIK
jgi:hypothetical protein